METPSTGIRLIERDDAEALAAHRARDAEAFARWDPPHPAEFYTTAGQRRRIERLLSRHDNGELWPGVVVAGDVVVVGQVTVQGILRAPCRSGRLCWALTPDPTGVTNDFTACRASPGHGPSRLHPGSDPCRAGRQCRRCGAAAL